MKITLGDVVFSNENLYDFECAMSIGSPTEGYRELAASEVGLLLDLIALVVSTRATVEQCPFIIAPVFTTTSDGIMMTSGYNIAITREGERRVDLTVPGGPNAITACINAVTGGEY